MKIKNLVLTLIISMMVMVAVALISGCATKSKAVVEEPKPVTEEKEAVVNEPVEEPKVVEEKVEKTVPEEKPDIKIVKKIEEVKQTTTYNYSVEFDSDSAVIRENYSTYVQEAIDFMEANPQAEIIKIIIEGRADSTGSKSHNYSLSGRRVNSVKKVLVEQLNVPMDLIETHSYGESRPLASNKTAAGRQKNRSVVVTISISY